MEVSYRREQISDGVFYNKILKPSVKLNYINIYMITPLTEKTASDNAFLAQYLPDVTAEFPTLKSLESQMAKLYGATLSGSVLKMSDCQVLVFTASCINDRYTLDNEKVTARTAEILFSCLTDPLIEDGTFDKEIFALKKQELIDEIMSEINEKRTYARSHAGREIYRGEPAAIPQNGELQNAEKITAESAYEAFKNLIKTAAFEVFFIGQSDEDADNMLNEIVKPALKKLPRDYTEFTRFTRSKLKETPSNIVEKLSVAQSKLVMAYKGDCESAPVNQLLNAVFGALPASKLFMNVREKMSLCYYCTSFYNELKGVMSVDSGVEAENAAKAQEEIDNQLKNIKNGEISDNELTEAKISLINALRTVNDSPAALCTWYFGRCFEGKPETAEQRIEIIKLITKKDLTEAAKTLKLDTVYLLTGDNTEGGENE
ncbi:MAG: insulinase family protein [Ruminococcus sp.]|jgi:predicted Zn-dependent peptidase|nr:insulinase family protein [Ruminococcus sp.]